MSNDYPDIYVDTTKVQVSETQVRMMHTFPITYNVDGQQIPVHHYFTDPLLREILEKMEDDGVSIRDATLETQPVPHEDTAVLGVSLSYSVPVKDKEDDDE